MGAARSSFHPGLIRLGMKAPDREAAIRELAGLLKREGRVKDSFTKAVLAREAEFPTGLPTRGVAIAIPHADTRHCLKPAVAVGILAEPVEFQEMGSPENTLKVGVIFLLSITNPEAHVEWLSRFAEAFQKPQTLQKLLEAPNPQEACYLLRRAVEE
ncbi:PTS sugar transporter subunit IIA [Rubrobacter taiwanensis]|jgi:PTS system galactitol-specific IIA component|uniref:PTS sugar transporter subunit IIA n=1 Tax=Rubrobacter taiwanensis TaxID=185139 RepID=A0A4V6NB38_9ACTN|nr:PTS sugar transporter subunit IIA [Rubrobacter taiwanensis]TCJ18892.1 PTS sugar transporter subunit IIA [Rubrobacter taiwanensis]